MVGGTFFSVLVVLFFLRAVKSQSLVQAFFAGVAYFLLTSFWSGYIFVQLLLSAYVVVLLGFNKCTTNVHTAFTVFFIVGNVLNILVRCKWLFDIFLFLLPPLPLLCIFTGLYPSKSSYQVPAGGFLPFFHVEFFPSLAVFVLLQLEHYLKVQGNALLSIGGVLAILFVAAPLFGLLKPSAAFAVFWAQFTSGNGSNWVTFFRDLHLVLFLFPAGVFLCFRKVRVASLVLTRFKHTMFKILHCRGAKPTLSSLCTRPLRSCLQAYPEISLRFSSLLPLFLAHLGCPRRSRPIW